MLGTKAHLLTKLDLFTGLKKKICFAMLKDSNHLEFLCNLSGKILSIVI